MLDGPGTHPAQLPRGPDRSLGMRRSAPGPVVGLGLTCGTWQEQGLPEEMAVHVGMFGSYRGFSVGLSHHHIVAVLHHQTGPCVAYHFKMVRAPVLPTLKPVPSSLPGKGPVGLPCRNVYGVRIEGERLTHGSLFSSSLSAACWYFLQLHVKL